MAKKKPSPRERDNLSLNVRIAVLTESGYRCAVPTCRTILALDIHHVWEVAAGGGDAPENLIALCPTCHALYHRGIIRRESIFAWKSMLVAMSRAFDTETIDRLLFLASCDNDFLIVSGDGLLSFGRLIASGLASVSLKANNNWQVVSYAVNITTNGRGIVDAWCLGDQAQLRKALSPPRA